MEMLNRAIAGADAFKKMMQKVDQPVKTAQNSGETRQQRRARERAEKKNAGQSVKA